LAEYSLTKAADQDLINIYLRGMEEYGVTQAERYLEFLTSKVEMAAENPSFGADYNDVRLGLMRYESKAHAIYYKTTPSGILVLRILGGRQDPGRHIVM